MVRMLCDVQSPESLLLDIRNLYWSMLKIQLGSKLSDIKSTMPYGTENIPS